MKAKKPTRDELAIAKAIIELALGLERAEHKLEMLDISIKDLKASMRDKIQSVREEISTVRGKVGSITSWNAFHGR